MPWVETESLSFTARHDSGDSAYAERTLDRMEDLRLRLEDRFEDVPGGVTIVVHTHPTLLAMAHPFLPAARAVAPPLPPAARRVGGAGRPPVPRGLGDGDRAARAQRPLDRAPR